MTTPTKSLLVIMSLLAAACATADDPLVDEPDPRALANHYAALDPISDALRAAYFAAPVTDVTATPDGGWRQGWLGSSGLGAVYAHPTRTKGVSYLVYGEILTLWEQQGAEAWIGYPLEEERDAGWGCAKDGALREQAFSAGIEAPGYHRVLCWAPGSIWPFEWIDDGAALTRLPPVQRGH